MNITGENPGTEFPADLLRAGNRETRDGAAVGPLSVDAGKGVQSVREFPQPDLAQQPRETEALAAGPLAAMKRDIVKEGTAIVQSAITEAQIPAQNVIPTPEAPTAAGTAEQGPSETVTVTIAAEKQLKSPEEMAESGNTGVLAPLMSNGYNPFIPQKASDFEEKERDVEQSEQAEPANNETLHAEIPLQSTPVAQRPPQYANKKIIDYVETVSKRAQRTNQMLEQRHLPYRFRIYTSHGKRVLIDMSILNSKGEPTRKVTRDITDEDFGKIMDNVSDGKGLFLDNAPPHETYYR